MYSMPTHLGNAIDKVGTAESPRHGNSHAPFPAAQKEQTTRLLHETRPLAGSHKEAAAALLHVRRLQPVHRQFADVVKAA
jgi:hypothetical protein